MTGSSSAKTQEVKGVEPPKSTREPVRQFSSGPYAEILALQGAAGNQALSDSISAGAGGLRTDGLPPIVRSVLNSGGGQPLDSATRGFMESRLHDDFSHVRVHTGAMAAESAQFLNANAYTVGNHIVFDAGKLDSHSMSGRRLLAHELAHTMQQSAGRPGAAESPGLEKDAESRSEQAMRGDVISAPPASAGIGIARDRKKRPPGQQEASDVAQPEVEVIDAPSTNSLIDRAFAAADAAHWEEAAELANGLSASDLKAFMGALGGGWKVEQLHVGALNNPRVGPNSQIAQMTRWSYLNAKFAEQMKGGFYGAASEYLNGFGPADIRARVSRMKTEVVAGLHQGAVAQPGVGANSNAAKITAQELERRKHQGDETAAAATTPVAQEGTQEKKRRCQECGGKGFKVFPLLLPKGMWQFSSAPITAERQGDEIRVKQPQNGVWADRTFKKDTKTLPMETFRGGTKLKKDEIVGVRLYDDNQRVVCVTGEEMLKFSEASDKALLFSAGRTALDAGSVFVPGLAGGVSNLFLGAGLEGFRQNMEVNYGLREQVDWGGIAFDAAYQAATMGFSRYLGGSATSKLLRKFPNMGPERAKLVVNAVIHSTFIRTVARNIFEGMRNKNKKFVMEEFLEQLAFEIATSGLQNLVSAGALHRDENKKNGEPEGPPAEAPPRAAPPAGASPAAAHPATANPAANKGGLAVPVKPPKSTPPPVAERTPAVTKPAPPRAPQKLPNKEHPFSNSPGSAANDWPPDAKGRLRPAAPAVARKATAAPAAKPANSTPPLPEVSKLAPRRAAPRAFRKLPHVKKPYPILSNSPGSAANDLLPDVKGHPFVRGSEPQSNDNALQQPVLLASGHDARPQAQPTIHERGTGNNRVMATNGQQGKGKPIPPPPSPGVQRQRSIPPPPPSAGKRGAIPRTPTRGGKGDNRVRAMNGEHGNGKPTPPPSSPGRQGDERQGLIRPPAPSSGEPEATLRTPTRELHPEPLVAHPTPSVEETNTLIEQRLPALGKKPKATEIALRKKTGVRKPFLSRANELGIKIGGRTQKGLAPTDTSMTVAPKRRAVPGQAVLPDAVNYAGQRTAQVLSQLSEIIKAAAKQNGMTPVEVQIGVAELPDGTRTVYISANDHESQLWMREALANPRQIFKDAVASGDGHVRRNIAKLLSPEKTRAERLGRAIENPNMPENTLDMSRAEAVAQMVFKGDVTVVVNKYGRHAEQNIYSAITARKNYTHLEIEGSLMRCAACGGVIGHNVKLDGVRVSGRFHVSQESEHQAAADLHGIRDGSLRVLDQHAPSNRRPSHSAPPDLGKNDPLPPMRDRLPPADLFDLLGEKPPTQNEAGESMATTAQGPKARVAEPEAASPLRVRIAVECSEEEAAIIEAESTAEAICEEDVKRRRQ